MITAVNERCVALQGLSGQKKPLKKDMKILGNGSTFIELDTAQLFMYDEEHDKWINVTQVQLGQGE